MFHFLSLSVSVSPFFLFFSSRFYTSEASPCCAAPLIDRPAMESDAVPPGTYEAAKYASETTCTPPKKTVARTDRMTIAPYSVANREPAYADAKGSRSLEVTWA